MGRQFTAKKGCLRRKCVQGAFPYKRSLDAEMCALPGQGRYAFGAPVEFRRCAELGRRWVHQVNWCASNPNRRIPVIWSAPQCTGAASAYVTLTEKEGKYDLCVKPDLVVKLQKIARRERTSLRAEVIRRSRVLCSYRIHHVFRQGRCTRSNKARATRGGTLMIGDSITWRGTDELVPLNPEMTVDGYPAATFLDLQSRLRRFRADHRQPTGLIVELGTNRARPRFARSELERIIASVPARTPVMFVLPYRSTRGKNPIRIGHTKTYARWMGDIATSRARTCLADWPRLVAEHPEVLGDGVHLRHASERLWARWITDQWSECQQAFARPDQSRAAVPST